MLNDLRFAVRVLGKSPAFLITAVLSLALGIGATTVVFSAFRAVFLPMPQRVLRFPLPHLRGRGQGEGAYMCANIRGEVHW